MDSPSIFISYSRKDEVYVKKLIHALEDQGLTVWLDNRIDYGTTWPRVIEEHLEKCQVFILVMSSNSLNSHWVQCELNRALALKKPIFPVLLEGTRWLAVEAIQCVDVSNQELPPDRFFQQVSDRLQVSHSRQTASTNQAALMEAEDDLSSKRFGVDYYARLRDFLKSRMWEAANEETGTRICEIMNRQKYGWLRIEDIENIPCQDLHAIDQLWSKYSSGHFGFSIQKKIWQACGSPKEYSKAVDKFGEIVGWKVRTGWLRWISWLLPRQMIFELTAPKGHLPCPNQWLSDWYFNFHVLFSRIEACTDDREDQLASERGMNYTHLRNLLVAQNWEAADQETYEVMIRAVGKKTGDDFTLEELLNFPTIDLKTIDSLWMKYSNGRFGFSVQKQIYLDCGAQLDGEYPEGEIWDRFCDRVGWSYSKDAALNFASSAPSGHLPAKITTKYSPPGHTKEGRIRLIKPWQSWGKEQLFGFSPLLSHRDL